MSSVIIELCLVLYDTRAQFYIEVQIKTINLELRFSSVFRFGLRPRFSSRFKFRFRSDFRFGLRPRFRFIFSSDYFRF